MREQRAATASVAVQHQQVRVFRRQKSRVGSSPVARNTRCTRSMSLSERDRATAASGTAPCGSVVAGAVAHVDDRSTCPQEVAPVRVPSAAASDDGRQRPAGSISSPWLRAAGGSPARPDRSTARTRARAARRTSASEPADDAARRGARCLVPGVMAHGARSYPRTTALQAQRDEDHDSATTANANHWTA